MLRCSCARTQVLSLRVRPGAPAALRLLPGHPFPFDGGGGAALEAGGSAPGAGFGDPGGGEAAGGSAGRPLPVLRPLQVMNGEALPEFQVSARTGSCAFDA